MALTLLGRPSGRPRDASWGRPCVLGPGAELLARGLDVNFPFPRLSFLLRRLRWTVVTVNPTLRLLTTQPRLADRGQESPLAWPWGAPGLGGGHGAYRGSGVGPGSSSRMQLPYALPHPGLDARHPVP